MARDMDAVRLVVRDAARELTGADGATFVLREGDLCFYADENAIQPLWKGRKFPMSLCISGWVMLNRQAVIIEDIEQDSRIPQDVYRPTFVKSLVMVPIRTIDPIGAIGNYWAVKHRPGSREVGLLRALADMTAVALENVSLYDQLEKKVEERTAQWRQSHAQLQEELLERKRLETQLIQMQKMESIGQLAAGVAHEINNPIGFVMSNLGTLSRYVNIFKQIVLHYRETAGITGVDDSPREVRPSEMRAQLQAICPEKELAYLMEDVDSLLLESKDGARRIQEIVRSLRSFSRIDDAEDLKEVNLNDCIESTLKIVWNELKYKCVVHKRLGDLPLIRCNPGHLNQVFMNLFVNAAQAIAVRGEITIETRATPEQVVIIVSDTGSGISPDILPQIFNPFFTTKPVGQGTGLGLSISYNIIRKHNGTIEAQSEMGRGTTFIIRLPRSSKSA